MIKILLMTDNNNLHPLLSNLPDRIAYLTLSLTHHKLNFGYLEIFQQSGVLRDNKIHLYMNMMNMKTNKTKF